MEANLPQPSAAAVSFIHMDDKIRPQLHIFIIFFQLGFVSVKLINGPWYYRRRISPGTGTGFPPDIFRNIRRLLPHIFPGCGKHIRHHVGNGASIDFLLIAHVLQIFAVKSRGIHVETGRCTENLRVSGPAKPFITLGAVRWHIQEITLLSPDGIFKETVYFIIGGGDGTRSFQRRINGAGFKTEAAQHILDKRYPAHLHIAETIEGKMRAHMSLFPVGDIGIFRLRRTQVIPVKIIILQDLPILQRNFGSFFRPAVKFHPSCDFLTKIQHLFSCRGNKQAGRREPFMNPHRHTHPLRQLSLRSRRTHGRNRSLFHASGEPALIPVPDFPARIIDLTIIDIGEKDRRRNAFPCFISGNHLPGAVTEGDKKLRRKQKIIPVYLFDPCLIQIAETAFVPAVSQHDGQYVFSRFQLLCYIIGLVLDPETVIIIKRRQVFIARFFPVQACFIDPKP